MQKGGFPPFCRVRQGQGSSARGKEWEWADNKLINVRPEKEKTPTYFVTEERLKSLYVLCFITGGWTILQLRIWRRNIHEIMAEVKEVRSRERDGLVPFRFRAGANKHRRRVCAVDNDWTMQ
jgi:hypothetical protein